jgi:hypothetical protein
MTHLTDDQLADWLAGERAEETRTHMESCNECRSEALIMRDGISRYRINMRERSRQAHIERLATGFSAQTALFVLHLRWAATAAVVVMLAAPTAWMLKTRNTAVSSPQATAPVQSSPATTMSDDELLEAVNNDVNRDVPEALAPVSAITVARNKIAAASDTAAKAQRIQSTK